LHLETALNCEPAHFDHSVARFAFGLGWLSIRVGARPYLPFSFCLSASAMGIASSVARRLSSQTCLLSEFLNREATASALPKLSKKAVLHGHCHHKAIAKMTDEEAILKKIRPDGQHSRNGLPWNGGLVWV